MKKIAYPVHWGFLFTATIFANALMAQPAAFAPARGHYSALSAFNPAPTPERAAWDEWSYPLTEQDKERTARRKPHYLTERETFDIAPFPANSSEQTRKELDYLLQLQQQRFDEDMAFCLYMATVWYSASYQPGDKQYPRMRRNLFFIGRSIGAWFNADSLPATATLISNAWMDASFYIWKYKDHFVRVRPYKLEPRLKNLEETNWPAYPSGHAGNSYVNAFIFSALAPEFTDVFMSDALQMAHSRERIGVHYPSDSEASRNLAAQLVKKLFESPAFLDDFAKAKEEWERVRARNF